VILVLRILARFFGFCGHRNFHKKIWRQDRLGTAIWNSVELWHPPYCLFSGAFYFFAVVLPAED